MLFKVILRRFRETGRWPKVKDVQREMVKTLGRRVDVSNLMEALHPERGLDYLIGDQSLAVLDVVDLVNSGLAEEELSDFLAVVKLAVTKYMGDEDPPTISSEEMSAEFGLDELRLRKVASLIGPEPITTGGGSSEPPYRWEYEVYELVTLFGGVESMEEYLAKRPRARLPSESTAIPLVRSAGYSTLRGPGLENLHPSIAEASGSLFNTGHFAPAIFEGFKAVEVRVREMSGLDASGRDLMARALSGERPRILISVESGLSGRDEQEGFKLLFIGAIVGIRNPKGHGAVPQDDPKRTLEYLAFASLLMHRLDDAVVQT